MNRPILRRGVVLLAVAASPVLATPAARAQTADRAAPEGRLRPGLGQGAAAAPRREAGCRPRRAADVRDRRMSGRGASGMLAVARRGGREPPDDRHQRQGRRWQRLARPQGVGRRRGRDRADRRACHPHRPWAPPDALPEGRRHLPGGTNRGRRGDENRQVSVVFPRAASETRAEAQSPGTTDVEQGFEQHGRGRRDRPGGRRHRCARDRPCTSTCPPRATSTP